MPGLELPQRNTTPRFPAIAGLILKPVPLFAVQPVLKRLVRDISQRRPELFERLGPHIDTVFVIDVEELPFVLRLVPNPNAPRLTAHRRRQNVAGGAFIRGPFMKLFQILDADEDSDAIFFARDVEVGGNTEAAVCLRNALDDLEGSVVDDILQIGGPLYKPLQIMLAHLRKTEAPA